MKKELKVSKEEAQFLKDYVYTGIRTWEMSTSDRKAHEKDKKIVLSALRKLHVYLENTTFPTYYKNDL